MPREELVSFFYKDEQQHFSPLFSSPSSSKQAYPLSSTFLPSWMFENIMDQLKVLQQQIFAPTFSAADNFFHSDNGALMNSDFVSHGKVISSKLDTIATPRNSTITATKAIVNISIWGVEDLLFLIISLVSLILILRLIYFKRSSRNAGQHSIPSSPPATAINDNPALIGTTTKPSPSEIMSKVTTSKVVHHTSHFSRESYFFPHSYALFINIILLCLSYCAILTLQCIYMGQEAYNIFNEANKHSNEAILSIESTVRGLFSVVFLFQRILSLNYFFILYNYGHKKLFHKIVFGSLLILSIIDIILNTVSHVLKILMTYYDIRFAGAETKYIEQLMILISASFSIFMSLTIATLSAIFGLFLSHSLRKCKVRILLFIFMHQFVWIIYETYRIISQFDILFGIQLVSWPDLIMQCILFFLIIVYLLFVVITIGVFNRVHNHVLIHDEWMALVEDEEDGEPTIFDFQSKSRAIQTNSRSHLFDQIPTHSLSPTRSFLNDTSEGTYGAMGYGSLTLGMRKATPNTSLGLESSAYSTKPTQPSSSSARMNISNRSENVPILKEEPPPANTLSSSVNSSSSSSWHK
ncbi:hypothetical protein FDP41_003025 [Naegleria fowleri]|uniref:Uncharacterized protein n=1 Tax=Naegleria fowleri TaxID=5763 RepID=A0A6A5BIH8_NAEFO|nr:uncharacterized protein FDP41_003025 [Naegleria fowleri]KAF0977703.1 hypothetical protein FDP41_003025 [Naegleria fowleri]CAG4707927.1 unnamed protein product [Naegleria fowleri]